MHTAVFDRNIELRMDDHFKNRRTETDEVRKTIVTWRLERKAAEKAVIQLHVLVLLRGETLCAVAPGVCDRCGQTKVGGGGSIRGCCSTAWLLLLVHFTEAPQTTAAYHMRPRHVSRLSRPSS